MKHIIFLAIFLFSTEAWVGGPILGHSLSKDGLFAVITGDSHMSFDFVDPEGGDSEKKDLSKKGDAILNSLESYLNTLRNKYQGNLSSWLYLEDAGKKLHMINFELDQQVKIEFAFKKPINPKELEELKKEFIGAYRKHHKK
jgi:hypothetical protein